MTKLTLFLVGFAFVASAAEYGHFSRSSTSANWTQEVNLNEGDRFVFLSTDYTDRDRGYRMQVLFNVTYGEVSTSRNLEAVGYYTYSGSAYSYVARENQMTITGPCSIVPSTNNDDVIVDYKIIRAYEEEGGSKFTASLNSDGSRLAIGSKAPGSNAVTRVYEFDGASWNQLGADVE